MNDNDLAMKYWRQWATDTDDLKGIVGTCEEELCRERIERIIVLLVEYKMRGGA